MLLDVAVGYTNIIDVAVQIPMILTILMILMMMGPCAVFQLVNEIVITAKKNSMYFKYYIILYYYFIEEYVIV